MRSITSEKRDNITHYKDTAYWGHFQRNYRLFLVNGENVYLCSHTQMTFFPPLHYLYEQNNNQN